jgi:hypothetical protein
MLSLEPHTIIPYAAVCHSIIFSSKTLFQLFTLQNPLKGMEFVLMLNILAVFAQFVRRM